mmetsp:Transcript_25867/g.60390  ORF Transcript_25867/g.60390 Transcript_25867/m.60390 type:complete len:220 (+) Transcript_25867:77-736(+)
MECVESMLPRVTCILDQSCHNHPVIHTVFSILDAGGATSHLQPTNTQPRQDPACSCYRSHQSFMPTHARMVPVLPAPRCPRNGRSFEQSRSKWKRRSCRSRRKSGATLHIASHKEPRAQPYNCTKLVQLSKKLRACAEGAHIRWCALCRCLPLGVCALICIYVPPLGLGRRLSDVQLAKVVLDAIIYVLYHAARSSLSSRERERRCRLALRTGTQGSEG